MSKINLNSTYGKAKGVVSNYIRNLSGSKVRRASQHLYNTLDDQAAYFSAGGDKGLKRQLHKKYNKAPLGTGDAYTHDIFGVSKAHKELQGAMKARKVTRLATGGALGTGAGGIVLHNSLKKDAAENVGPYGNEEQSRHAMNTVYRGMRRGAGIGAAKGAVGGAGVGALMGGFVGGPGANPILRGAAGGAMVGMLANAVAGGIKGGIEAERSLAPQPKTAALNRATIGAGLNKAKKGVLGFGKSVTGSTYRRASNLGAKLDDMATARAGAGMFDDALINTMNRRNRVLNIADKAHSNMWRDRTVLGTGVVGTGTLVAGTARKGKYTPPEEKTAAYIPVTAILWQAATR